MFQFSLLFFTGKNEDGQTQIKPENKKQASFGENYKLEVDCSVFLNWSSLS